MADRDHQGQGALIEYIHQPLAEGVDGVCIGGHGYAGITHHISPLEVFAVGSESLAGSFLSPQYNKKINLQPSIQLFSLEILFITQIVQGHAQYCSQPVSDHQYNKKPKITSIYTTRGARHAP
jgi:hypothetical protein